jgi:hypothetical protein
MDDLDQKFRGITLRHVGEKFRVSDNDLPESCDILVHPSLDNDFRTDSCRISHGDGKRSVGVDGFKG